MLMALLVFLAAAPQPALVYVNTDGAQHTVSARLSAAGTNGLRYQEHALALAPGECRWLKVELGGEVAAMVSVDGGRPSSRPLMLGRQCVVTVAAAGAEIACPEVPRWRLAKDGTCSKG
jgi:hypothetical protein